MGSRSNQGAFTLLEVLLAAVIFVVSVAGIFVTINVVRGPVANKESQLASVIFGKQAMEALYSQVESATFSNSCQSALNADQSCPDFSLSVGQHETGVGKLNWPSGLAWPANLAASNVCPTIASGCLNYYVNCADGSSGPSCTNSNVAHRLDLNINWPSI